MRYQFSKELYPRIALIKGAYNFTDVAYIHLDADQEYYYVDIEMKQGKPVIQEKDFVNEMLAQSVRHEIYTKTKDIRELLLARAMATTIVADTNASQEELFDSDQYDESEILKDWFQENDGD
jgi:His-Xaa-Ser system protein HxsD